MYIRYYIYNSTINTDYSALYLPLHIRTMSTAVATSSIESITPTPNNTDSDVDYDNNTSIDKPTIDYSIPHKLYRHWTLYYTPPKQTTSKSLDVNSWSNLYKKVITIDTVELYWKVYNNIKLPTQLTQDASYYLFVHGIEPKWEDNGM